MKYGAMGEKPAMRAHPFVNINKNRIQAHQTIALPQAQTPPISQKPLRNRVFVIHCALRLETGP